MSELIWHDLECGRYGADLAIWRALAEEADGPVLDIGAGSGRVTLDLLRHGHEVVALDHDAELLVALTERARAAGLPAPAVVQADARDFALTVRDLALVIVPMQTVQLLGGAGGRGAMLAAALVHMRPGGRLALALADAFEGYDDGDPLPPAPDIADVDGVRYVSQAVAVRDEGDAIAIDRIRTVATPGGPPSEIYTVRLDHLDADTLEAEGEAAGFTVAPSLTIAPTEEHVGSTVVVLDA